MVKQKRTIVKQFIYNVIGTTFPTLALQLLFLPMIAKNMDGETYGFVLTIVAAVMMVSSGIGNVLNNIRMLSDTEYETKRIHGDFGYLFIVNAFATSAVIIGILYYYGIRGISTYLLTFFMSLSVYAKDYYIVRIRIALDYWKIMICNFFCVLGYAFGYGLFCLGGEWQYIYIIGSLFGLFYNLWKFPVQRPFFAKTALFVQTAKRFGALATATILGRSLQYIDRLLLFPLLGGEDATIYYVSTLIGKTIAMALTPLNSFLLSQLAKKKELSRGVFGKIMLFTCGMGFVGYWICIIVAKPLLGLLYPQWIAQSMKYIYVTTLAAIISAISTVLNPIVLKFCNMNWQIVINGVCFVVYLIISLALLKLFGLMGFCIGNVIANGIMLLLMVIAYQRTYKGV